MKEVSPSNYSILNNRDKNIQNMKIYPSSYSSKDIENSFYNIRSMIKKKSFSKNQ